MGELVYLNTYRNDDELDELMDRHLQVQIITELNPPGIEPHHVSTLESKLSDFFGLRSLIDSFVNISRGEREDNYHDKF